MAVTTFSIAVNTGFGDNKRTTWWTVKGFGDRHAKMVDFFEKGDPVIVSGEPYVDVWEKDGESHERLSLRMTDWAFIEGKKGEQENQPGSGKYDDDVPF